MIEGRIIHVQVVWANANNFGVWYIFSFENVLLWEVLIKTDYIAFQTPISEHCKFLLV
jgi:hypothetical protein